MRRRSASWPCCASGIVVLLTPHPPAEQAADVRQAAAVCPALAIVVED